MRKTCGLAGLLLLVMAGCAHDRFEGSQWVVLSTNVPAPRTTSTYRGDAKVNRLAKAEYDNLRRTIEESPASAELKQKMLDGKPLGLADISALAEQKVSEALLLDYIRATDTVYVLTTADIVALRNAGLSDQVIDGMLSTRLRPTLVPYPRYYPYYYDPFWSYPSPYYYPYHYHYHPHSVIRRVQ